MAGPAWIRFYSSDWRSGCIGLSLKQEGLYIRICAYIYETGRRLPLDDSKAAKFLGVHTNAYVKVRDSLSDLGLVQQIDDGWTVRRAERELALAKGAKADVDSARHADGAQRQNRRTEVEAVAATLPDTVGDTPTDTPHNTPVDTPRVFSENTNEINGPLKNQNPEPEKKIPPTPQGGFDEFTFDGKRIIAPASCRAFWADKFDDASFDLALIECAGSLQPNSRAHSVHAQVQRKLAQIARDKRDRDQRYAKAVEGNKPAAKKPAIGRHGFAVHEFQKPEWAV